MINAIIFDFGRVISVQKPLSLFGAYEVELGLPPDTINAIMFDSPAWRDTLIGYTTEEEYWYAIGPELGLNTQEAIDAFRKRYRAHEAINTAVLDLISQLQGRYKLAVLSNSPPGLEDWLDEWQILDLFDIVFCSGDEGVVKPDPKAYMTTLERLGVVPQAAVFIDDAIDNVEAARALGMQGIHFSTAETLVTELKALRIIS